MSFNALDTSQSTVKTSGLIDCLKQNGITTVGRYYAQDRALSKVITAAEASALSEAGIKIWAGGAWGGLIRCVLALDVLAKDRCRSPANAANEIARAP